MNGSSSESSDCSLPSGSFLSDAFVGFSLKVGEGHFWTARSVHGRPGTSVDVFFNRGRAVRKGTQASERWQPPAPRCSWCETISLISSIFLHSLAIICFSLGFKFCCMVLRVANARALIIDLRRLCYWPLRRLCTSSSVRAGNNVFGFWPFVIIFLTGASPSFASIMY